MVPPAALLASGKRAGGRGPGEPASQRRPVQESLDSRVQQRGAFTVFAPPRHAREELRRQNKVGAHDACLGRLFVSPLCVFTLCGVCARGTERLGEPVEWISLPDRRRQHRAVSRTADALLCAQRRRGVGHGRVGRCELPSSHSKMPPFGVLRPLPVWLHVMCEVYFLSRTSEGWSWRGWRGSHTRLRGSEGGETESARVVPEWREWL